MRRGLERAAARPTSVATGKRLKSQDEDPCHGTCPGARCSVSQSVHKMCEIGSRSRHILSGRLLMRHGGAPLYLAPRNLQFRSNVIGPLGVSFKLLNLPNMVRFVL